ASTVGSDMEGLFAELTALVDVVNSGTSGLAALQRVIEFTQTAVDAGGVSFVEYSAAGGRGVGRSVAPTQPLIVRVMSQGQLVEVGLDEMPLELAEHMKGAGLCRMLT